MNSIVLLPLFVAAATAASLYPRTPASTYLFDYPIAYPEKYPVEPVFKNEAEMRQLPPLPVYVAQQAVLTFGDWHVRNTIAFWNLMSCIADASCPTISTSSAPGPIRIQTLIQQILNDFWRNVQENTIKTLAEQIDAYYPGLVTEKDSFRQIPAFVDQYPGYFVDQSA